LREDRGEGFGVEDRRAAGGREVEAKGLGAEDPEARDREAQSPARPVLGAGRPARGRGVESLAAIRPTRHASATVERRGHPR
jgi:hypothetical protein